MTRKKRILVSPLNWGLGHATRCIPIIRELLHQNVEVIVAAEGRPKALLAEEFPFIQFISLPGYNITYPKDDKMTKHMLKSLPVIFGGIIKEHQSLNKVIDELEIDGIISDNRYGLYTKKVKTVVITHQLAIQAPSFKKTVNVLSHWFIKRFDQCWIPDYPDSLLGMGLSTSNVNLNNHKYIGPLSRFQDQFNDKETNDLLVVISGPEPQRTIFEKNVFKELEKTQLKVTVVLGKTEESKSSINNNITVHSHLNAHDMEKAFQSSKLILARSGYSTLMDLERLNKRAILVPTPGQPEQEYLAEQLHQKKMFYSTTQDNLELERAIVISSKEFTGYVDKKVEYKDELRKAVIGFIESIDG